MGSPEYDRRIEAELSAHLMSCPTIPVQAIFNSGKLAKFFDVSPSVITNWAARYGTFPDAFAHSVPKLYDIRAVVRWWIHWNPEKGKKSGRLPADWFDHL